MRWSQDQFPLVQVNFSSITSTLNVIFQLISIGQGWTPTQRSGQVISSAKWYNSNRWQRTAFEHLFPAIQFRKDPRDRAVTVTRQNGHFLALHHRSCLLKSLIQLRRQFTNKAIIAQMTSEDLLKAFSALVPRA